MKTQISLPAAMLVLASAGLALGAMQGRPVETSSRFKGDWLKADCDAVKPYCPK